jgi:AcrR family transcriptional regulator
MIPDGSHEQGSDKDRRPTSKGAQTRRAILQAAIVRFGRDGYRATSVADIARDAAVGGSVAYAYFPNKEALFFAAVDEDVAGFLREGLATVTEIPSDLSSWHTTLIFTLAEAVQRHPMARRLMGGQEPEVTLRVLELPALDALRKACVKQLRTGQDYGVVRPDIDPVAVGNGLITLVLSVLMSVTQLGDQVAVTYAHDVVAVFEAALMVSAAPGSAGT